MSHAAGEDLVPPLKYLNCKKNNNNWISENDVNSKFINQQTESPLLDRRLMALKYSETFKISSRAEASMVLKLTQQLSDSLEQYFLNCKGLEVLDSGLADNTTEMYDTSRKILASSDYGKGKLGLESTVEKPLLDIEPTFSACTSTITYFLDSLHEQIDVSSREEHTSEVISSRQESFPKDSSSGSQSRKRQKCEAHDEIPFVSSQSVTERHDEPSQSMPVGFSSQSCSTTGPYYSSVSESNFKANTESKPHVVSSGLEIKTQSDLDMESNESDFDTSSLHSSSSQETPSSSQVQRKTSKTLSPDILQLLKGKDANTVANILKTLSPFYPALQDLLDDTGDPVSSRGPHAAPRFHSAAVLAIEI